MHPKASSSWRDLLADPGPDGHIVQLYQNAEFYSEAISHFAAEGSVRGESIIIVATAPNWENISARLTRKGFDIADLSQRGQLTLVNADDTLQQDVMPQRFADVLSLAREFEEISLRSGL